MDSSTRLAFPGRVVPPIRKVVPGFGLWVSALLVVISLLLFSTSTNSPSVTPLFRQFIVVGRVNSSLVAWPSPFTSTSYFPSSYVGKKNYSESTETVPEAIFGKEKTHFGNSTEEDKNGGFSVQQNTNEAKSGNFSDSGAVLEGVRLGNSSDGLKNGNLSGKDVISFGNVSIFGDANSPIREDSNGSSASSLSYNEELGRSNGGENSGDNNQMTLSFEACDIFDGRWVRDDSKPYYPAGSCPHIDRDFDCHLNQRPDDGFVRWKWQPNGCKIPSLNATDFLERLRGKKLVFVGDSLNRNMWESLVCILRHSIRNKKRVYEISGRREFKKKGFYAFIFEDYNCTVDFVGSPFLLKESSFKGRTRTFETLRLDLMDATTSMYHDADVIVFNTGHWWTHEKTSRGEDYYQEGNYVHPRLKVLNAYKRALMTWAKWIDNNIDSHRTQVFFRGYSVTHFRGGQWNSGGQCHKESEPIFNTTYLEKYPSKMKVLEYVLQQMKTPVTYLNISRLTDYRKDGHPSIYRMEYKTAEEKNAAEQSQDCSHWCLPGVPDTWNELLYVSLLKNGRGSWKT